MEWESEIPKCLFSSVESTWRAPTFSGCAWAGLVRICLLTELHVQHLLPLGKRVGSGSDQSHAQYIPAVASFEADTLCPHAAATVVSSLCLLFLSPGSVLSWRPSSYLGTPRPSLLQIVGGQHWPGSGTHSPQLDRLPTSEGKGEHLAAEAWKHCLRSLDQSLRPPGGFVS